MSKKVIALIPSRWASKRFFAKSLALIQGKTLIERTYENVAKTDLFDHIYVATDEEKIAGHIRSFNGNVIMTSSCCKSGTERIAEALQTIPDVDDNDIIVNVQGDHPCILEETFSQVIRLLQEDQEAVIGTAASIISPEVASSPHIVKVVFDHKKRALYFSRALIPYSTEKNAIYHQHIGIYAYRASFLKHWKKLSSSFLAQTEDLEQLQFMENGYAIKIAIVNEKNLGVDIPEDIQKIERYLSCQKNLSL